MCELPLKVKMVKWALSYRAFKLSLPGKSKEPKTRIYIFFINSSRPYFRDYEISLTFKEKKITSPIRACICMDVSM